MTLPRGASVVLVPAVDLGTRRGVVVEWTWPGERLETTPRGPERLTPGVRVGLEPPVPEGSWRVRVLRGDEVPWEGGLVVEAGVPAQIGH